MKATGIVRKVDELGRIVLPVEMRRTLDIAEKDALEIYVEGTSVILKKYKPSCIFCDATKNVTMFKNKASPQMPAGAAAPCPERKGLRQADESGQGKIPP